MGIHIGLFEEDPPLTGQDQKHSQEEARSRQETGGSPQSPAPLRSRVHKMRYVTDAPFHVNQSRYGLPFEGLSPPSSFLLPTLRAPQITVPSRLLGRGSKRIPLISSIFFPFSTMMEGDFVTARTWLG